MESGVSIGKEHADWLVNGVGTYNAYARNESAAKGEPLILIRTRAFKEVSDTESEGDPDPCDGIMLWIEEK